MQAVTLGTGRHHSGRQLGEELLQGWNSERIPFLQIPQTNYFSEAKMANERHQNNPPTSPGKSKILDSEDICLLSVCSIPWGSITAQRETPSPPLKKLTKTTQRRGEQLFKQKEEKDAAVLYYCNHIATLPIFLFWFGLVFARGEHVFRLSLGHLL